MDRRIGLYNYLYVQLHACVCLRAYMCVTCVIWVYACEPVAHIHTCMTGKFDVAVTLAVSNPGDLTNKGAKSPSAFVASRNV